MIADGLEMLGAEEKTAGDKTLEVIKKVGPGLVSAITEAVEGKPATPTPTPTPQAGMMMPTWGWALVGVAGLALVGGLIYAGVKKS